MIRPAREGDAGAIVAHWNRVIRDTAITFLPDPRGAAEVADMIASRPGFLVAEEDGAIAGFVTWSQFRAGRGYARSMEHTVILGQAWQGRGLGTALLAAAEEGAAGQGAHVMVAGVSSANPGGRAFHLARGYAEAGVLPEVGHKFGRWLDLHLLTKRLG